MALRDRGEAHAIVELVVAGNMVTFRSGACLTNSFVLRVVLCCGKRPISYVVVNDVFKLFCHLLSVFST